MVTEDNKVYSYCTRHKDHVSATIAENGVETKLWLKQGFRSLFVKKQSFQGLDLKKPGTKT